MNTITVWRFAFNFTTTLPYVGQSGTIEAEIDMHIYSYDESNTDPDCTNCGDLIYTFSGDEGDATFNITANPSESCKYMKQSIAWENDNLYNNYLGRRALEGINSSAGTFDFSITVPSTRFDHVTVAGEGLTGDGRTLNRDLNVKCQVDGHPETYTEFKVYCTDTFAFTQVINNIPKTLDTYTMRCTAIDRFFGEDAVQAVANFERVSAGGGEPGERDFKKVPVVIIVLGILIFVILLCIVLSVFFMRKRAKDDEDFTRYD